MAQPRCSDAGPLKSDVDLNDLDYRSRIYDSYVHSRTQSASTSIDELKDRAPYLRRLIAEHFPADRNAHILDLGAGTGSLMHFARRAGYENMVGVDRSAEQVTEARRLGNEKVEEADLMNRLASLPPDSHDVIIAFDVIEHFTRSEVLAFADEVRRVLKQGGKWIIHTPNAESPFFGRIRYGDFTHEQAFTTTSIGQLLLSSGFRSLRSYEDEPIVHGFKSAVRYTLWKAIRGMLRLYIAAETGSTGPAIFSQNFLTVAMK